MIQRTLVLLKPDAVLRGIVGEIVSRFERSGLKIVAAKMVTVDENLAGNHYEEDMEWILNVGKKSLKSYKERGLELNETEEQIGRRIRESLIKYLIIGPVLALVLESHDAIKHVRKLVGKTSPSDSAPGTIRGDYSFDTHQLGDSLNRPIQNLIHASDSVKAAEREIELWFNKDELHSWKRIDESLLYRKGD